MLTQGLVILMELKNDCNNLNLNYGQVHKRFSWGSTEVEKGLHRIPSKIRFHLQMRQLFALCDKIAVQ